MSSQDFPVGWFHLGQYRPSNSFLTWATMNPDTTAYCVSLGMDMSLFPGGNTGQVTGPQEQLQMDEALRVAKIGTSDYKALEQKYVDFGWSFPPVPPDTSPPRPFWTFNGPYNGDVQTFINEMFTGSGSEDVVQAAQAAGYCDRLAADGLLLAVDDYFTEVSLGSPGGKVPTPSWVYLAELLRVPFASRIMDPTFYVDPATGGISLAGDAPQTAAWANHLGGEHVNIAVPERAMAKRWLSVEGYIGVTMLAWFDEQGAAGVWQLRPNFLDHYKDVQNLSQALTGYCKDSVANYDVGYSFADLISPVPVTPRTKSWLKSTGSSYYLDYGLHPPTFGETLIDVLFWGINSLGKAGDPNISPVQYEGKTSPIGVNTLFRPYVLNTWADRIQKYLDARKAAWMPIPQQEVSLLAPIAQKYKGPNVITDPSL